MWRFLRKKCNTGGISFPYSDLDKNVEERDGGERLTSGSDYKGRRVMSKIKVMNKQLKAELRRFQFAGLHETEGLNMMIHSSAEKQTRFWMNWEL